MTPIFAEQRSGNDDYDQLPAAIRAELSLREWLWLSDLEKTLLVQRMTEPEE